MNIILHRGRKQPARRPLQQPQTAKPRLERLEDRLALSGFGPEDGAYVVEPWQGSYQSVEVRPSDQAIIAAGKYEQPNVLTAMAVSSHDSQGGADSSFGTNGVATIYHEASAFALTLQSDGKPVVVGDTTAGGDFNIAAARLTQSGQADRTFGTDGLTIISTVTGAIDTALSAGIQSTGKVVMAGKSGVPGVVARVTTAGLLDTGAGGFGDIQKKSAIGYHRATELDSSFTQTVWFNGMAVQPDDKAIVVGTRTDYFNGQSYDRLVVERYTANGAVDSTFNRQSGTSYGWTLLQPPAGKTDIDGYSIALQQDGKIIVAGQTFSQGVSGSSQTIVARYTASGALDTTFGAGTGYVLPQFGGTDVAIQPDGKIILAGSSGNNWLVARLNPTGDLDTTFNGTGYKESAPASGQNFLGVDDVALQADGSIIVAGQESEKEQTTGSIIYHPLLVRFYGDNASASTSTSSSTTSTADATDAALLYLLTDPSLPGVKRKG